MGHKCCCSVIKRNKKKEATCHVETILSLTPVFGQASVSKRVGSASLDLLVSMYEMHWSTIYATYLVHDILIYLLFADF